MKLLLTLFGAGFALLSAPLASAAEPLALPTKLQGKAVVLTSTSADYARADTASAVKPAGQGGLTEGLVVQLTEDVPVYRMWSGPAKKDSRGNTNRIGQWWSYDAPTGPVSGYRTDYEICNGWNDLTWVATCTLKKGSVVVIGPGQSVSAESCGDPTGQETYAANLDDWQVFVSKAWSRSAELVCPADTSDYEANPADISKPKAP